VADARTEEFPLLLTTGRVLAQYQSGTQTRRSAELMAIAPEPIAQLHPTAAAHAGIVDNQPVVLTSRRGSATFTAKLTRNIREDTVFVPFHWSGEQSVNRLTIGALDPISRMPEFKVCAVRAERPAGEAQ
jgi:assimilatory nitrate reductase catalytic subunit